MSDDLSIPSPTYRVPRRRKGMDPMTKRLALISCGLGGALVVVVGSWTLISHRTGSVPVIQAASGPVRVKPENPGGMQIAGANEDILSGTGTGAGDKLAPPPETPDPQALRAPPPPPPAVAPTPAPTPAPIAQAPVAPPPPMVAPPKQQAAQKPAAAPEHRAVAAAPIATPDHASPSGGHTLVQLAAVGSEEAAKVEWQRLEKRFPELLGQHRPAFSKIDHDGHVLWRVRTGGFGDVSQATAFCERVRAKGAGCSVADF